jgi:hypothetical protein
LLKYKFEEHLSWFKNEGRNVGLRVIFLIGQIVFSWILILNLFIVVDVVFECLRQHSNRLKICENQKTWSHRTNSLFTHEYHIPLGRYPQGIWYSWVNTFSYFHHQHAINVYYYTSYIYYHIYINLIGQ